MLVEENKQLVLQLIEKVGNQNHLELLGEFFVPGSMIGASFRDTAVLLRTAFPNLHVVVDHILGEDDQVVVVVTMTGENAGPFMGQPPTGQSIVLTGIYYFRIRNGRIYTARYESDVLGLLEQLGMISSGNRPDI